MAKSPKKNSPFETGWKINAHHEPAQQKLSL